MSTSPSNSPTHWSRAKVPPNGALIKIDDGKERIVSSVPKVLPGYRKRASTLGVISEHSEHGKDGSGGGGGGHREENNRHVAAHSPSMTSVATAPGTLQMSGSRSSLSSLSSLSSCGGISPTNRTNHQFFHSPSKSTNGCKPTQRPTAKAGIVKALGENVRGKFQIDDQVLALVGLPGSESSSTNDLSENDLIRNLVIRGTDYVIVNDALNHVFPVPGSLSLASAAKLGDKGVPALALMQALDDHCSEIMQRMTNETQPQSEKIKILLVLTEEMTMLSIPIIYERLGSHLMDRIQITAATLNDDGIVWLKKNFPRVCLVQWNNDAYEQVLLERTRDACKGLIDIVACFDTSPRALLRSVNCLKKGGSLFCTDDVTDSVWKNIETNAKNQGKNSSRVEFRSLEIMQQLIDLVKEEKIELPPLVHANKMATKTKDPEVRLRSYSTEE